MASMLYALEVPSKGGNTLFANAYKAYETLPDAIRTRIEGRKALNAYDYEAAATHRGTKLREGIPSCWHPIVRTHPATGKKALYVNRGFTKRIVGIPRDESNAILHYLCDIAEDPLFQCRFRWRENSIAFWDNRCAQHRAMWDYWPHTRSGHRVTVAGDRPV